MALASNDKETDDWIQEYRRRQSERAGRSYINGKPSAETLGKTAEQVAADNPVYAPPSAGYRNPYSPQQIAENRQAMISRVGGDRSAEAVAAGKDRYNAFLRDRGINPNTLGTATISDPVIESRDKVNYLKRKLETASEDWNKASGSDNEAQKEREYYQAFDKLASAYNQFNSSPYKSPTMAVPTVNQEFDAINAGNFMSGIENTAKIAARRMSNSNYASRFPQNPALAASILNTWGVKREKMPTTFEGRRDYWMDRLASPSPYEQWSANGFPK